MLTQWNEQIMVVDGFTVDLFVFDINKPLPYSTVDRTMKGQAEKAGITKLSPHGLRHNHISYLIKNGINYSPLLNAWETP